MRAAFFSDIRDTVAPVGALLGGLWMAFGWVVAGIIIYYTQWLRVDPLMSLVLVGVIIFGTWELLRDSLNLALDAVNGALLVVPSHGILPLRDLGRRDSSGVRGRRAAVGDPRGKPYPGLRHSSRSRHGCPMRAGSAISHACRGAGRYHGSLAAGFTPCPAAR